MAQTTENNPGFSSYTIENMTPEQLQNLLSIATTDEEREALMLQYQQALAKQQQAAPQGQMVGRVYVGADPFSRAANLLDRYQGVRQMREAQTGMDDLTRRRQQVLQQFAGQMFLPTGNNALDRQQTQADILRTPTTEWI